MTKKFLALFLTLAIMLCSGATSVFAAETDADKVSTVTEVSTESNDLEIPEDAKVVEIIDFVVGEDGTIQSSNTNSRSYYDPAAITLSPSGNAYRGMWRTFDGNYIAYEVTARYADGRTSNVEGLYIALEACTPAGDLNRQDYRVKLDGVTRKYDDWREIWGSERDYRFVYYNATYGTSYADDIWVKVTVYSWD